MTVPFLSGEWVDAYNDALGNEPLPPSEVPSLRAEAGRFAVAQTVRHAPPGDRTVTTVLRVDDRGVRLELAEGAEDRRAAAAGADVVISLDYGEAARLARGELDAADAVSRGLVQVRGDLSLLLASQDMLARAAQRLVGLAARTTY